MIKIQTFFSHRIVLLLMCFLCATSTITAAKLSQTTLRKANAGNGQAMLEVATHYDVEYRRSDETNADLYKQAEYWFKKAAQAIKSGEGWYELAMFYNKYNQKDKGWEALLKSSTLGYADASYSIASTYRYGWYGPKDPSKCLEWYEKAYKQGKDCRSSIADCYLEGVGAEKNVAKGLQILAKMAKYTKYEGAIKTLKRYGYGPADYDRLIAANVSTTRPTTSTATAPSSNNSASSQSKKKIDLSKLYDKNEDLAYVFTFNNYRIYDKSHNEKAVVIINISKSKIFMVTEDDTKLDTYEFEKMSDFKGDDDEEVNGEDYRITLNNYDDNSCAVLVPMNSYVFFIQKIKDNKYVYPFTALNNNEKEEFLDFCKTIKKMVINARFSN